jgi:hypothetical protein
MTFPAATLLASRALSAAYLVSSAAFFQPHDLKNLSDATRKKMIGSSKPIADTSKSEFGIVYLRLCERSMKRYRSP